ncbi:MAG: hypothetical protein U0992_00280 [Planctomycetaceae bacterium]
MRVQRLVLFVAAVAVLNRAQTASAQLGVQQPVVGQFSADTIVSVPDQGRLFLGGVGSAQSSQRVYGPLPSGTATGRALSNSSLDVGVYIHDFEAIDAALLAQPTRHSQSRASAARFRSPRAAAAWRVLHDR